MQVIAAQASERQDLATFASPLTNHALEIWQSAVAAVQPRVLIPQALADPTLALHPTLDNARRIIVIGAGKAGAAMSAAVEESLHYLIDRMEGIVNVPAELVRPLRAIRLHPARPFGSNQPTAEGVEGTRQILDLLSSAARNDVALCLLSGGGSALLPAPVEGITLEDKQRVTQLLHACGANIYDMNTVRKHLSASKGGRLAQAFRGKTLFSLIISDVIGDAPYVVASGPTARDPTTFADALTVLDQYRLTARVPASILTHLRKGVAGEVPETLKRLPRKVHNYIIGDNTRALAAAEARAKHYGYRVLNLGPFFDGETRQAAGTIIDIVRIIREQTMTPPFCVLSGGETTVTLTNDHGLGGRNQEFALAAGIKLGLEGLRKVIVLSGGTDGEDGPTDAAGAFVEEEIWQRAQELGLNPETFLARHDAYHFFEATGGLLKTGLTETNVMDVRVILVT